MSGRYLLDTNAVIALLKDDKDLLAKTEAADMVAISI